MFTTKETYKDRVRLSDDEKITNEVLFQLQRINNELQSIEIDFRCNQIEFYEALVKINELLELSAEVKKTVVERL